jgi:soluble lytic murein transglycosylase-like protein/TolA-binding protein
MRYSSIALIIVMSLSSLGAATIDLSRAIDAYASADYEGYLQAITTQLKVEPELKKDPILLTKIGYSYQQTGQHDKAEIIWQRVIGMETEFADFIFWNRGLNFLANGDTLAAIDVWQNNTDKFQNSHLSDRMHYFLAEIASSMQQYDVAVRHLTHLIDNDSPIHSGDFLNHLALKYALANRNNKQSGLFLRRLVNRYPASNHTIFWIDSLSLVSGNPNFTGYSNDQLLKSLYYHKRTRQMDQLNERLKDEKQKGFDQTIQYYNAQIAFQRKQYETAMKYFKSLDLRSFKPGITRQIERQKARILYRQGKRSSAYKAFAALAKKYPNWTRALDLLWVAGLDAERRDQFTGAIKWYRQIIDLASNHELAWRARFRIGYLQYRQKKYRSAASAFADLSEKQLWYVWRNRAKYWHAKALQKTGKSEQAKAILTELGQSPAGDYYALKAFHCANGAFPAMGPRALSGGLQLGWHGHLIAKMDDFLFARFHQVYDIFGREEAGELLETEIQASDNDLAMQLTYLNLLRNYDYFGKAYRAQLRIFNRHYSNILLDFDQPVVKLLFPLFYDEEVFTVSRKNNISDALIFAIVRQESAFDHLAYSRAGAIGLMQLMPATARDMHHRYRDEDWDISNLENAEYNLDLGTRYLKKMQKRYDGFLPFMLIAYNAGPHRADKWKKEFGKIADVDIFIESVRFNETRNYIKKVMRNYWVYKILLGNETTDVLNYSITD